MTFVAGKEAHPSNVTSHPISVITPPMVRARRRSAQSAFVHVMSLRACSGRTHYDSSTSQRPNDSLGGRASLYQGAARRAAGRPRAGAAGLVSSGTLPFVIPPIFANVV